MRERTYQIISKERHYDPVSHFYDLYIMALAFMSVVPLMFRNVSSMEAVILSKIETITVFLLLFDYVLRWMTHDYRTKNHTVWAFIKYPLTPLAVLLPIFWKLTPKSLRNEENKDIAGSITAA